MASPLPRRGFIALLATALLALPILPAAADPTLTVTATPAFSPNGDGRLDDAVITVTTSADVDIEIVDADGGLVRDLAAGVAVDGEATFTWHGLTDGGGRAPDGRYRARVTATDGTGSANALAPIALDTTAPTFAWRDISPEPLRTTGSVRFAFTLRDRLSPSLRLSLAVTDAQGRLVERDTGLTRQPGDRTVSWDARHPGTRPVPTGLYRAAFTVVDEAGNRREARPRPFRDHRPVKAISLRRVDGAGPRVALAFDDCIYGAAWRSMLTTLEHAHVQATFFCNGDMLAGNAVQARRAVRLGEGIGSHTWDHRDLLGLSTTAVRSEVVKDQTEWWRIARTTPAPYFRPPNGDEDGTVLDAVGSVGFRWSILWDVDPQDWTSISPTEIRRRVVEDSRAGSIVIMHVKPRTAQALPGIIRGLRAEGLQPVSVPALLRAGGLIR
jgi:peptidoglycan/xylan/chitin deacetylase (PgdA/CDA1 family)/flagellar hook assembly protein FlgD